MRSMPWLLMLIPLFALPATGQGLTADQLVALVPQTTDAQLARWVERRGIAFWCDRPVARLLKSAGVGPQTLARLAVLHEAQSDAPTPRELMLRAAALHGRGDRAGAAADLQRVLRLEPDHVEALWALARHHETQGAPERAEPLIERVAGLRPHLGAQVARFYDRWARTPGLKSECVTSLRARARSAAAAYLKRYRGQLLPTAASPRLRRELAACLTLLPDHARAEALLEAGERLAPRTFTRDLVQVYSSWAWTLARDQGAPSVPRQVELLFKALRLDPLEEWTLQQLTRLGRASDPTGRRIRDELERTAPRAPDRRAIRWAQASIALDRHEWAAAVRHLRAMGPDTTDFGVSRDQWTNNLVWAELHIEPAPLERLLRAIDPVVRRHPSVLAYRDTRGRILARLGRHREALRDLEPSVREHPDDRELNQLLAECYVGIGDAARAATHRARAARPRR